MKMTIEIDDKLIKGAIAEEIGRQVSTLSREEVLKQVDEIMTVKAERLTNQALEKMALDLVKVRVMGIISDTRLTQEVQRQIVIATRAMIKGEKY
jgi:hypothetical protein